MVLLWLINKNTLFAFSIPLLPFLFWNMNKYFCTKYSQTLYYWFFIKIKFVRCFIFNRTCTSLSWLVPIFYSTHIIGCFRVQYPFFIFFEWKQCWLTYKCVFSFIRRFFHLLITKKMFAILLDMPIFLMVKTWTELFSILEWLKSCLPEFQFSCKMSIENSSQ